MSQFTVVAQDFWLLAPVEIARQVADAILLVVEHLAADVADEHDVTFRIDGDVSLRLLARLTDDSDVVVCLVGVAVRVVGHLYLVPVHRLRLLSTSLSRRFLLSRRLGVDAIHGVGGSVHELLELTHSSLDLRDGYL